MEQMKIVIVGHVDHGKSTLIGRLFYDTGRIPKDKIDEIKKVCKELGREFEFAYILDHLEEERQQGITIDTAQTFFRTKKRKYVIIDAPGHVEFLKNMITGASQAEAAVLIVDADEGVKEQTKRHAYLLHLLGLNQVIVAVNKMDLAGYKEDRFNEVKEELIKFLGSLGVKPSYVIPISAKQGDNIAKKSEKMRWYGNITLLEALDAFKTRKPPVEKPLRYPVQDVYRADEKRIIAGRVESGRIRQSQKIIFLPSKKETGVKSIEFWKKEKKEAGAGESIGITTTDSLFIERGEIACGIESQPDVTDRILANIFWMGKEPLKLNEKIIFKCTTQETECIIEKIEEKMDSSTLEIKGRNAELLETNEVGFVAIKTMKPVVAEKFSDIEELGRFVLERGMDVIAGGIITRTK